MSDSEERLVQIIGKRKIAGVVILKTKILFTVNGWSYEVRKPSQDFINTITEYSQNRLSNALQSEK